jgi:hypothetical protein
MKEINHDLVIVNVRLPVGLAAALAQACFTAIGVEVIHESTQSENQSYTGHNRRRKAKGQPKLHDGDRTTPTNLKHLRDTNRRKHD